MAGPEEYRLLTEQYFKCSDGFVFCCALNSPQSLDDLEERIKLLVQVRNEDVQSIPVIISVNKSDLLEGEVTIHDVKEFAKKYGIQHIVETSAKEGTNVKELFEKICWMSAYNVHASKTYCVEQFLKNPNWIKNLENGKEIFAKQMSRPKKQKCNVM
jgi:GTPase SAR1 family protein